MYLISAFDDKGVDNLKIQKLLFLFCQEQEKPAFDFVPYRYVPYSFQARKDLYVLQNHYQLLTENNNMWTINYSEDIELKANDVHTLDSLLQKFSEREATKIIHHVYAHYPYYAINSKWHMTKKQREEAGKEKATIEAKKQRCLFTIGYEGRSIDAYLDILVKNNISLLCDVRKNPLSMKYGFSKSQLDKYCDNLDIGYVPIPELGIASQKRQHLKKEEDYQNLFSDYKEELSEKEQPLRQVSDLLVAYRRIALTCFEKEHTSCHRHCVSDYLSDQHHLHCEHL